MSPTGRMRESPAVAKRMPERAAPVDIDHRVAAVMRALEAKASARMRADMGPRFGIRVDNALGVPMAAMQAIAKPLAPDHALAEALWSTGLYEARMLACMLDDPALVTAEQMDRWRSGFDNWAIVDTACFRLFDRVPGAFAKVEAWAALDDEFGRRAGFALLASLPLHGRATDAELRRGLALIEAAADDERNFVKKGVSWALRAIGGGKRVALCEAARDLAERLAAAPDRTERWIGRDALRAFAKAERRRSGSG